MEMDNPSMLAIFTVLIIILFFIILIVSKYPSRLRSRERWVSINNLKFMSLFFVEISKYIALFTFVPVFNLDIPNASGEGFEKYFHLFEHSVFFL